MTQNSRVLRLHPNNGKSSAKKYRRSSQKRPKFIRRVTAYLRKVFRYLNSLPDVLKSRFTLWRSTIATGLLLGLFGLSSEFYFGYHNIDTMHFLTVGKLDLTILSFLPGTGFAIVAPEILYWSSIGVLIRKLSVSAKEAKNPEFDLVVYLNEVISEWISIPIVAVFVTFFLSAVNLNLSDTFQLSLSHLRFEVIVALGFVLGYFAGDAPRTLAYFRVPLILKRGKSDEPPETESTD